MFKNYLTTALRNLLKNRLYSLINIAGLSLGLAVCLMIGLYVQVQNSYDKHWRNGDSLYRLNTALGDLSEDGLRTGFSPLLALPGIRDYFGDQILRGSRIRSPNQDLYVGDVRYQQEIFYADPEIVDMLDFEVLHGDLQASLNDYSSVALSSAMAEFLFGVEDAVGQIITIERSFNQGEGIREDFRVAAVYRLPDANSVLDLPLLLRLDESKLERETFFNWFVLDFMTLVQLAPGIDADMIHARMDTLINRNVDIAFFNPGPDVEPADRYNLSLQRIGAIYLDDSLTDNIPGGNKTVVLSFSAIAVLVLLIGCINFTLLSTAKSTMRATEVAMRKTVGASRSQLILQYLGESLLVVLPAVVLSLVLAELMLPLFEGLVGKDMDIAYTSPFVYVSLAILILLVTLIGGFYPSLILSYFKPGDILKTGKAGDGGSKGIGLRNALVIFQFSISIALIIATAVIYAQVTFTTTKDPGFNGENVLVIDNLNRRADVTTRKVLLKDVVEAIPGVESASLASYQPGQTTGYSTMTRPITLAATGIDGMQIATTAVDHDFFRVFGIPIITGRDFTEALDRPSAIFQGDYQEASSLSNAVINAAAATMLGFATPEEAIGTQFSTGGFNAARHDFTVVGVAADTQYLSRRQAPRPEIFVLSPRYLSDVLNVKIRGDAAAVFEQVQRAWQDVMGDAVLASNFVEARLAQEFAQEQTEAGMLFSFSLLAIVIACLGLYGSAVFTVDRRTKEIGIRKVMGAEVREIVALLMWQFSKPVLIANVIAWPVALWAMLTWLQRFPYQIDTLLLIPLCVLAGALALSIAWLTVAGNTVKVATTNPVYALRYE